MNASNVKTGMTLVYDDGRIGHRSVKATVISVSAIGMVVQFEDRADTTAIRFADADWMKYLAIDR